MSESLDSTIGNIVSTIINIDKGKTEVVIPFSEQLKF